MTSRYERHHWKHSSRFVGTRVEVGETVRLAVPWQAAWARIEDSRSLAGCLPGLVPGSLEALGSGRFSAKMRHTALGVTAEWDFEVALAATPEDRRLDLQLAAREPRLRMEMTGGSLIHITESNGGTALSYEGSVEVRGALAALGAPIVRSVVAETLHRFVISVGAAPTPPSADRSGGENL